MLYAGRRSRESLSSLFVDPSRYYISNDGEACFFLIDRFRQFDSLTNIQWFVATFVDFHGVVTNNIHICELNRQIGRNISAQSQLDLESLRAITAEDKGSVSMV